MKIVAWGAIVLCAALGGCASTADYNVPLQTFATSAQTAETALTAIDQAAATRIAADNRNYALDHPSAVIAAGCADGAQGCALQIAMKGADGNVVTEPLVVTSFMPNHLAAMHQIVLYAKALSDLAAADNSASVSQSLGQVVSSGSTLATLVDKNATISTDLAGLVNNVGSFAFTQIEGQMKLDALRAATSAMRKPIDDAARYFDAESSYAGIVSGSPVKQNFQTAQMAYIGLATTGGANTTALDALVAAAAGYDNLLKVRRQDTFTAFAKAHDALDDALNGRNVTPAQAIAQIDRFATAAQQLLGYVRQYQQATAAPATVAAPK